MNRQKLIVSLGLALGLILCSAAVSALLVPGFDQTTPQTSGTRQNRYATIRYATASDAAVEANDLYWDTISATGSKWSGPMPASWNTLEFAVYAYGDGTGDGDPNGGSCTLEIYAARPYSSAKLVWSGTVAIGELELSCDPNGAGQYNSGALDPNQSYKWADTIATTASPWAASVVLSGNTGANDLATISVDAMGCPYWWARISSLTGVTKLTVVATGF